MTIANGTWVGSDGSGTWRIEDEGTLYVEGTGKMEDYGSFTNPPWTSYKDNISKVVIGEGITHVGDYSFYDYTGISAVTFSNTVESIGSTASTTQVFYRCGITELAFPESLKTIGSYAFQNCASLTSVTFPTSMELIGQSAFTDCTKIASLDIRNVQTIGQYAFAACVTEHLSVVNVGTISRYAFNISKLKTAYFDNIQTIESEIFGNYANKTLKSVIFGNNMSYAANSMFNMCEELESVELANVTRIRSSAFYRCKKLKSIDLSKVKNIESSAFTGCSSLRSIDLASIETIGDYAFAECKMIKKVVFPATLTSLGNYSFKLCMGCEYYEFKGSKPSQIYTTSIASFDSSDYATYAICKTNGHWGSTDILGNYVVVETSGWAGEYIQWSVDENLVLTFTGTGVTFNKDSSYYWPIQNLRLRRIVFEEGITDITSYFMYNLRLKYSRCSVKFPDTLTGIGDFAFYYASFTRLTFPENLQSIGERAFGNFIAQDAYTKNSVVIFRGKKPSLGASALGDINSYGTCHMFSPYHPDNDKPNDVNTTYTTMVKVQDGWIAIDSTTVKDKS